MSAACRRPADPFTPVPRIKIFASANGPTPCALCPMFTECESADAVSSHWSTPSPASSDVSPWLGAEAALLPIAEQSGLPSFCVVNPEGDQAGPLELGSIQALSLPTTVFLPHQRRRLVGKMAAPVWYKDHGLARWSEVPRSQKWKLTRQALDEYRAYRGSIDTVGIGNTQGGYYERRRRWSDDFKAQHERDKVLWYLGAYDGEPFKRPIAELAPRWSQVLMDHPGGAKGRSRLRGCLITWNGEWDLDCDILSAALARASTCSAEQAVAVLQQVPFVKQTLQALFDGFMACKSKLNVAGVTVAVELSTHSEGKPRIHFHAFMHAALGEVLVLHGCWDAFLCGGVNPSHAVRANGDSDQISRFRCMEGHYYLQFAKIGHIMHLTNYAAWDAFVPKRSWMLSKYQTHKMTAEAYLAETLKLKQGSIGIVRELEHQLKLEQQHELESELHRIEQAFKIQRRPSIPHPVLVQEFMSQFRVENWGVLSRTKPLVLDGPTQFGKSTFAEGLFGSEKTIIINCQNCLTPPMQRFRKDWRKYSCIVFEEVDHRMVCGNKLLFQGSRQLVDMGLSPTEQHAYTVLVYFKAMVLCSNRFLDGIDDDDKDYVLKNVFYQRVDDYMYQRD